MNIKLFTDASFFEDKEEFYFGGYITDNNGKILFCFFDKEANNVSNSNEAEIFALKKGLEYCKYFDFKSIEVFTDSLNTVKRINSYLMLPKNEIDISNLHQKMCFDAYHILNEFEDFSVKHLGRETNVLCDRLARYGQSFFSSTQDMHRKIVDHFKEEFQSVSQGYDFLDIQIKNSNLLFKKKVNLKYDNILKLINTKPEEYKKTLKKFRTI